MTHYINIIKDTLGNNYLGITIPRDLVEPFLNQLKDLLGEKYDEYVNLQQQRDSGKYHLTFMNTLEFNSKSKEMGYDKFASNIQHLMRVGINDLKLIGLGTAQKSDNTCYFVVVESTTLDDARDFYDLEEKDFHITIGFKWKDVHGVRKNIVMKTKSTFLEKLSSLYRKEGDSFEFIKGIKNFDLDFFKQILPIEINETNGIFRCGENDYIQISLVENNLLITAKWQDTKIIRILSTTLIEKKFKKIN